MKRLFREPPRKSSTRETKNKILQLQPSTFINTKVIKENSVQDTGKIDLYRYYIIVILDGQQMPITEVRAFRDDSGIVPVQKWLDALEQEKPKAYRKCLARILELAERGNEMRRPHADYLRDAIYELRATTGNKHYRILYFFFGKHAVALSHGITKESAVPSEDIEIAIKRMSLVKKSPDKYTADFIV